MICSLGLATPDWFKMGGHDYEFQAGPSRVPKFVPMYCITLDVDSSKDPTLDTSFYSFFYWFSPLCCMYSLQIPPHKVMLAFRSISAAIMMMIWGLLCLLHLLPSSQGFLQLSPSRVRPHGKVHHDDTNMEKGMVLL